MPTVAPSDASPASLPEGVVAPSDASPAPLPEGVVAPSDASPAPLPEGVVSPSDAEFDLCVFDIAGTTVEEHQAVYAALEGAVRAAGVTPTEAQVQSWMGADKAEAIADALGLAVASSRVTEVYADFRERLRAAYEATPPEPLPGIPEAIATLRAAGVKVVLSTGFSREVTDGLLKVLEWTDGVVDSVVSAEEVGAGRPAPFMIFEAMRRTGVFDVRRVLVAGDTARDLQAGVNAGVGAVIGVLSGAQDADALGRVRHTHLLPSVADIPALIL